MRVETSGFVTKELTNDTLPDFERLFDKHPAPGAYLCWCMYHHVASRRKATAHRESRREEAAAKRNRKRELVKKGRSHGILVYSKGEPVGWCQYGSWEELPRFDGYGPGRPSPSNAGVRQWRITCFTVERGYRNRGVAQIALHAALDAIKRKGGGLVEAYPISRWGAYREYLGTASMFKREGFEVSAYFGKSNVVMRKII